MSAATWLASCGGPALAAALFLTWGNEWDLHRITRVLLVGLNLELPLVAVLLCFEAPPPEEAPTSAGREQGGSSGDGSRAGVAADLEAADSHKLCSS